MDCHNEDDGEVNGVKKVFWGFRKHLNYYIHSFDSIIGVTQQSSNGIVYRLFFCFRLLLSLSWEAITNTSYSFMRLLSCLSFTASNYSMFIFIFMPFAFENSIIPSKVSLNFIELFALNSSMKTQVFQTFSLSFQVLYCHTITLSRRAGSCFCLLRQHGTASRNIKDLRIEIRYFWISVYEMLVDSPVSVFTVHRTILDKIK